MHNYILTLGIVLLAVISLTISSNLSTYARSSEYLKEDLEIAVHDASLQLDQEQLSEGRIVFDEVLAKQTFRDTLELNTGINEMDYKVINFEVLDHSNSQFPVEYQSLETGFSDTFFNPSILAIIETSTNKYFFTSQDKKVTRVASYSYQLEDEPIFNMSSFISSEPTMNGFHWIVPYTKNITSPFSPSRINPVTGILRPHKGVDIALDGIVNEPVVSALSGVVTYAGWMNGYGNIVEVNHNNGLITRYAHLNAIYVNIGNEVEGGQLLGLIGSTGNSTAPHLHFETIVNGEHINPLQIFK